jgi:hypothetical protein
VVVVMGGRYARSVTAWPVPTRVRPHWSPASTLSPACGGR